MKQQQMLLFATVSFQPVPPEQLLQQLPQQDHPPVPVLPRKNPSQLHKLGHVSWHEM
jgi:hypothetical protein